MDINVKQVIVVRRDLKMRTGKIGAQCSHASMSFLVKRLKKLNEWDKTNIVNVYNLQVYNIFELLIYGVEESWLDNTFTKVVLKCHSENELLDIYRAAQSIGLESNLIQDNGTTEFHGIPTYTCCAIGPDLSSKIDPITGHLELY